MKREEAVIRCPVSYQGPYGSHGAIVQSEGKFRRNTAPRRKPEEATKGRQRHPPELSSKTRLEIRDKAECWLCHQFAVIPARSSGQTRPSQFMSAVGPKSPDNVAHAVPVPVWVYVVVERKPRLNLDILVPCAVCKDKYTTLEASGT